MGHLDTFQNTFSRCSAGVEDGAEAALAAGGCGGAGLCPAPLGMLGMLAAFAVAAGATYSELVAAPPLSSPVLGRAAVWATTQKCIKNAFKGAKQVFHDTDKLAQQMKTTLFRRRSRQASKQVKTEGKRSMSTQRLA